MALSAGEASSSSATPRSHTYHVFLSFRGEDTRKGFTDHLCAALERKGIRTYRDDKELERGDVISSELLRAIEESMFAVTVLSPNYASSDWCLDEIQHIVECSKNKGLEVVPVFYGVEPSDVRHQRGSFEGAFIKHEQRFGQGSEKIKRWKDALAHIACYSGWDSKDQHEARFVESIAEHIYRKLIPKLPSYTKNLVGIGSRVEQVIRLIGIGLSDVRFVGIWGMGGIGKTTIARAVYEVIRGEFTVSCFVRNVRELSETNGFVHLQRGILSSLNVSSCEFSDVEDGRMIIENSLCNKKVLLVLDDVSQEIQLKNLAWKQDWFGPGSRIIITTRDMHLLNGHGVQGIYEAKGLCEKQAHRAFCMKAFKQEEPNEGYSDLSYAVVYYTKGLPLALEILGSYLYGRNVDFWHNTIREIRSGPPFEIHKALKISYDHLSPTEKNIFLDIACFFKGMNKDEVTHTLKVCNLYVGIGSEIGSGIVTLIDKSLITLDHGNNLQMHDLLQEMGRHIVYEESPTNPGRRSRLWSRDDIDQVLTNDMGTDAIQGLALRSVYQACWSTKAFSKTRQLKFLNLYGIELPHGLDSLPGSLKVLHWKECPLETLPLTDQSYQVVEMKLLSSRIKQLWHGKKSLTMLRYLDLSHSYRLKQTPDLSMVPILETLILEDCEGLIKVHPSLVHHKKLVLLNLSGCIRLKTLPGKQMKMSCLKELILSNCSSFENLPEFGECMKQLSTLLLDETAIRKLPTSVGYLVGLECLKLCWCESLVSLPDTINQLKSLRILDASGCLNLCRLPSSVSSLSLLSILDLRFCNLSEESFPHDFCHLSSLTDLHLTGNPLASLPINFQKLPKLRHLFLRYCPKIRFLPELPSSIRELEAQQCDSLDITQLIYLSKSCNISASSIIDHGEVGITLIPESKIPSPLSLFKLLEDGNCLSLPPRNNCLPNQRLGISLHFLLETFISCRELSLALYWNRKRFLTRKMSPEMEPGRYLYSFALKSDYWVDEFREGDLFELLIEGDLFEMSIEGNPRTCAEILSSAAQWT